MNRYLNINKSYPIYYQTYIVYHIHDTTLTVLWVDFYNRFILKFTKWKC